MGQNVLKKSKKKIYVHTDKPYYISGERIWFRAHIADAVRHIPTTISRYVYVELINPLDSVVTRVKIREDNGAYHGYLSIPDTIPEGDYTLRAYTLFMRSMDENYFFTKSVHIGDPQNRTVHVDERIPAPDPDFDVTFYPEGGSLMMGTSCKVVFKAMKSNGQAISVSGVIYDHDGIEIRTIETEHLGMGSFFHQAEKGKSYYAVCENGQGQTKRFNLPAAIEQGYALSVNTIRDKIYVKVLQPAESALNGELFLFAHTRGVEQLTSRWDHNSNIAVFQKDQFPSGVLHFILFDDALKPVSERLVFINNADQAQVSYQNNNDIFSSRSLVKNRVKVTDRDGEPVSGSFSVAVTSDREVATDTTTNILAYLLLSSDLRGHIENPASYFRDDNASAWTLDLLMLTQGWRRYDVAELIQGRFARPTMPIEEGAEISGTVKSVLLGKPVENVDVTLLSSDGAFNTTVTDKDGRFVLNVSEQPDSTRFIVRTEPNKGTTRLELILDKESFPEKTLSATPPAAQIDRMKFAQYADIAEKIYTAEHGLRTYFLPEVAVTAKPKKQVIESPYFFVEMLSPRQILTEEDIAKSPSPDIAFQLSRIPGVIATRHEISRGFNISTRNGAPLLVIDDIPIDGAHEDKYFILNEIKLFDIDQIAVLKGPETSAFGSRGMGGVILINTKRGGAQHNRKEIQFHTQILSPLGYQKPVEFYAPKYDTPEKRNSPNPDLRTTIHWQPVVKVDRLGVATFEFYTADQSTSYTVIIEGLTDDGRIIHTEKTLWNR